MTDVVWTSAQVTQASTEASWNSTSNRLTFAVAGLFEIKTVQRVSNGSQFFYGGASNQYVVGLRSDLATSGPLLAGSKHLQANVANINEAEDEFWYEDTFYYQATAGETVDLTASGSSGNGSGGVVNVSLDVSVRKVS